MKYFTKSSERASECFLAPRYTRFIAFTSKNDLKGNENCFELAGGSSYRGFELPRVKLQ